MLSRSIAASQHSLAIPHRDKIFCVFYVLKSEGLLSSAILPLHLGGEGRGEENGKI